MHKTIFRQRPIDHSKEFQLIKSLNEVKKNANQTEKEELNNIESELKKILELYDKKKKIITPNSQKIDNPTEKKVPQKQQTKTSTTSNSFESNIELKQTEFIRPEHYIIYSEKTRRINHKKEYEATKNDLNFLKIENNFMTPDELERTIAELENDIGVGEQIPPERVKKIILGLFPDKSSHVEILTKVILIYKKI